MMFYIPLNKGLLVAGIRIKKQIVLKNTYKLVARKRPLNEQQYSVRC
jgi:hypothetical protein